MGLEGAYVAKARERLGECVRVAGGGEAAHIAASHGSANSKRKGDGKKKGALTACSSEGC
jgi:hypothetical protein